jgi:hypothetical protein
MRKVKEKISWVLSDSVLLDPTQDIDLLKAIGPFWGSWRTWRACQTDNVICHDQIKVSEFLQRDFQQNCNLFIPDTAYASLGRPDGVKIYAGEFVHDLVRQEEIVALHLAATTSDIVLLLGWNLQEYTPDADLLIANKERHHRNMVRQAFLTYEHTQWVVIDHPDALDKNISNLPNIVTDTLDSVIGTAQT